MSFVDVVIPVYKPEQDFFDVLQKLLSQTVCPTNIWLMQTVSTKEEPLLVFDDERIHVLPVLQSQFDHGETRAQGAMHSEADYLLFMTQDAVPKDDTLIQAMVEAMADKKVGVTYARQLARADAGILESLTREYNYPAQSQVKSLEDEKKLGIKTYFCSDVCAMYRREYYEQLGGFRSPMIFNEDMIMAYDMIHAGYQVVYQASAQVIHSHNYTCMQQFHRNFDLGVSQKQYSDVFASISSEKEGAGYAMKTIKTLLAKRHPLFAFYFAMQCGFKLIGYKLGLQYEKLPKRVLLWCTGSKWFWKE